MPFAQIGIFLDTGLQKQFVPLRVPQTFTNIPPNAPDSLKDAVNSINAFQSGLSENEKEEFNQCLNEIFEDNKKPAVQSIDKFPFIKIRFGYKTWNLKNGSNVTLEGIWFLIETNTSSQDCNRNYPNVEYDRGYYYETTGLTETEKNDIVNAYKNHENYRKGYTSPYINLREGEVASFECQFEGKKLNIGDNKFELIVKLPGGQTRDIDVILDLGNTRTAGLLFEHDHTAFNPNNFKAAFKVLRIKPDPQSGEYNTLDDVEAGIAQSWMVLHQLEHQVYQQSGANQEVEPKPILKEIKVDDVKVNQEKFIFITTKITYDVIGKLIKRIPQMFMQLSPVLLGDQAERQFNLPYAKAMIAVGAKIQQSSPKRYYWDDVPSDNVWWNMLLNEWDPSYNSSPQNNAFLPYLQGEMLRFINQNGKIMDFNQDKEPWECPLTCPTEPNYPRQSTLTWFLLHILELAYSQSNTSFTQGAVFIPHRLKRVLITYPAGWTKDEVGAYRERCQEALDIFSQTNVYKGIKSDLRLEMVPATQTPDEAVAGQLPIVFSEIIRYPTQKVSKWIKVFGKKRKDCETIRIMNFDIGGGTTDISIIEYKDNAPVNSKVALNILKTTLLFKDSKSIAGDELVKRIIEKYILGGLLNKKNIGDINIIKGQFTKIFTNPEDEAIRSRIIRTCLIPLAIKVLTSAGTENTTFSPREAGINQNNWNEFLNFIDVNLEAIPISQTCFSFNNAELNDLIEELYSTLFMNSAIYAAAYDIDMLIFSGKTSELPHIKNMAQKYVPIDNSRILFSKGYKAGQWYPFADSKGYITDAKTVTVVGAALYYALSNGFIAGWQISTNNNVAERNEWGEYSEMLGTHEIFMDKQTDIVSIDVLPNTIMARRLNIASSPEPVYKFISHDETIGHELVNITLERKISEEGEKLVLKEVNNQVVDLSKFELKLWPCAESNGNDFWQEKGIFNNL